MSHEGADHATAGAGAQDLPAIRERMALIKKEVAAEVEARWTTSFRTPEVFDLKVNSRLAAHQEYRELQERARRAEAGRGAPSGPASTD